MPLPEEFGQWKNYDERLMELNSRLLAWQLLSEQNDLTELFAAAQRRYQRSARTVLDQVAANVDNTESIVENAPRAMLLEAFEQALNDMDQVLDVTSAVRTEDEDD